MALDSVTAPDIREHMAWAAGLFEGEGCVSARVRRTNKHDRSIVARLRMSDEDVVRRFHSVVGVGHVNGPYLDSDRKKPTWVWQTGSFEAVQAVIAFMWPWLHSRRRARMRELLTWHHGMSRGPVTVLRDRRTGRLMGRIAGRALKSAGA